MAEAFSSVDTRPVISLPESDRATFIGRVYSHLAGAIALFVAFEFLLFQAGVAERFYNFVIGGGSRWFLVLGLFMVGSWLATTAAADLGNPTKQYVGLVGMAAVYSVLFTVPLFRVFRTGDTASLWSAVFVTAIGFAGLTAVGWFTKNDLSFLRPFILFGGMLALVAIVGALIFGFHLGVWFSVAMIGLMGASILYQTQNIIRRYPSNAYVGAAVQLFSSVMTLFWYVLRIFVARD